MKFDLTPNAQHIRDLARKYSKDKLWVSRTQEPDTWADVLIAVLARETELAYSVWYLDAYKEAMLWFKNMLEKGRESGDGEIEISIPSKLIEESTTPDISIDWDEITVSF